MLEWIKEKTVSCRYIKCKKSVHLEIHFLNLPGSRVKI